MLFQERIRENYEKLTPGFRKLADFIVTNTLDAAFLTATELSRRVEVDPATVVRFAQDLGYTGYRELSREIKRYVRDQVTESYQMSEEASSIVDLLRALAETSQQNFQHFTTTELPHVAQIVEHMLNTPQIWLTGEYSDYALAEFMAKNLGNLNLKATAFSPDMRESAAIITQMREGDVLLALATCGPSLDTGYVVRLAREKGVKTVCLSSSGVVLAAREASLNLSVPVKSPASVPSFAVTMNVLALIWEALAKYRAEQTGIAYATAQEYMGRLLEMRAATPSYEVAPQETWTGYKM